MSKTSRRKGIYTTKQKNCEYCSIPFVVYPPSRFNTARFCSLSCARRWQVENKPPTRFGGRLVFLCKYCHKQFLAWKHEAETRKFCSLSCKQTYYKENTKDISVLRERAYDRDKGRCVDCNGRRYLETHHINGDKKDNRLDNLATLCKRCHVRRHIEMSGGINSNGTRSKQYQKTE